MKARPWAAIGAGRPSGPGIAYLLILLSLANLFAIGDRLLLGILQEPIKHEFALSDFALGLLGGPAFAILYGLLNLPIARLAERRSRVAIISTCIGIFCAMTASCGLAATYAQLLCARVAVSIGEAGSSPAALSLISERIPAGRRTGAMAVFGAGGPAGALVAILGGGWLAGHYGWRSGFIAFGLGGLPIAALIALSLKDPRRAVSGRTHDSSFPGDLAFMFGKATFRRMCMANLIGAFCSTFILQYLASFLIRVHGLSIGRASSVVGVAIGIAGMAGALAGGYVADRLSRKRPGAALWVGGAGMSLAAVFFALSFLTPLRIAIPMLLTGAFGINMYPAVAYAATVSVVPSRMRATAIAILTLGGILFGAGLGPPIFGAISDALARLYLNPAHLDLARCAATMQPICRPALGNGLRWALVIASLMLSLGAAAFFSASRSFRGDVDGGPA